MRESLSLIRPDQHVAWRGNGVADLEHAKRVVSTVVGKGVGAAERSVIESGHSLAMSMKDKYSSRVNCLKVLQVFKQRLGNLVNVRSK